MSYFFAIPVSRLSDATALQREVTGRPDDPPIFDLARARGASREDCWLYAHGRLWTAEQTEHFVERIAEVAGVATLTFNGKTMLKSPADEMEALGARRRPDLALLTVTQLKALAKAEGMTLKSTLKADIIREFEEA